MPRISRIEILQQTKQPIMSIRKTVTIAELPQTISSGFSKLSSYLQAKRELLTDVPFVIYHNYQNMDGRHIDVEMTFPVSKTIEEYDDIRAGYLAESKVAFCMYQGSNAESGPVFAEIANWITKNGFKISGNCHECYYNGPDFPESQRLTKIMIPIE